MKKFIKTGVALAAAAVLLSGCGDGLLVMNEAEEAIVVSYSAGALAKRNRYQPEGLTAVYEGEEDEETEEPVDTPAEPEEDQDEGADSIEAEEPVDTPAESEEDPEIAGEGADTAGGAADASQESVETADLAGALGLSGIQMSYTDYFVSDSYQQGDYFSLDADPGNVYVILNFNVTNNTAEDIPCDMLTKQPIFTLEIGEGTEVRNDVTVLSNDLSTYHETIGAGQTEAVILLFEVPEDVAENISSLQMSVQTDGAANRLNLE